MANDPHTVDLGSDYETAMLELMKASIQAQDHVDAIANGDTSDERMAAWDEVLQRISKILSLPIFLTEDVLRGTVQTKLNGSVLQFQFTSEQFNRMNTH